MQRRDSRAEATSAQPAQPKEQHLSHTPSLEERPADTQHSIHLQPADNATMRCAERDDSGRQKALRLPAQEMQQREHSTAIPQQAMSNIPKPPIAATPDSPVSKGSSGSSASLHETRRREAPIVVATAPAVHTPDGVCEAEAAPAMYATAPGRLGGVGNDGMCADRTMGQGSITLNRLSRQPDRGSLKRPAYGRVGSYRRVCCQFDFRDPV